MESSQGPNGDLQGRASGPTVLFVHDGREHIAALEDSLRLQRVGFTRVRNCQEAHEALEAGPVPLVVFTDTKLPDGTFEDILVLTAKARQAVNVLVASEVGNIRLYEEAMEQGAFDFLTPNIESRQFRSVFASASSEAQERRARRRQSYVRASRPPESVN